jgi:hypothetical protein
MAPVCRGGGDRPRCIKLDKISRIFAFPNPVNEIAARTVAAGVVVMASSILVTGWMWVLVPLTYGFVARVVTGPTLSPLGQLATRVIVPRLPLAERPVDGPPKRFAQGIGATLTSVASVAHFGFGATTLAMVLVAMITVAATLEGAFGYCIGCKLFGALVRLGVLPDGVCAACADLSLRQRLS